MYKDIEPMLYQTCTGYGFLDIVIGPSEGVEGAQWSLRDHNLHFSPTDGKSNVLLSFWSQKRSMTK